MDKLKNLLFLFLLLLNGVSISYAQSKSRLKSKKEVLKLTAQVLAQSVDQYKTMMRHLPQGQVPRTFEDGKFVTASPYSWISGFYPGSLLYLYEYSGDSTLLKEAEIRLKDLEKIQYVTANHDLGFMMYCSFGNAYRLRDSARYKDILVQSAKSLVSRFSAKTGSIKSWNKIKSLDGERMLNFPVIIDNMMNLELLFFASKITGDPSYKEIAIKHTETTLRNHFRPDYSSYHVVDYDEETGAVKSKETHQGFSDNSTWARGQAWAIYGFTMVYRETKVKKYLEAAQKMAAYFINHPKLTKDKVPYWDFNVNQPGFNPPWKYDPARYQQIPRDASAAAIVSSALIELAAYAGPETAERYLTTAEMMLKSLSSAKYRAAAGTNGGFILMHSSGGVPSDNEVNVPVPYADYYYLEALMRYRAMGG